MSPLICSFSGSSAVVFVTEICARELIVVFGKLLLADVVYCDFKVNVVSG